MGLVPETTQLLSRLPTHLATDLFASANPVKLAADQVLFLADDPGDSCYRVEDGLLKVIMVSPLRYRAYPILHKPGRDCR